MGFLSRATAGVRRRRVMMGLTAIAALCVPAGIASATPPVVPTVVGVLGQAVCDAGSASCGRALIYPSGGDVDAAGNIYTADTGNDEIEKWDPAGNMVWRVGLLSGNNVAPGRFLQPRDLAYLNAPGLSGTGDEGLLFIADIGNSRIQVLNAADGSVNPLSTNWTPNASIGTRFHSLIGISAGTDGSGHPVILTADSTVSPPIREWTPDAQPVASFGGLCTTTPKCDPNLLGAPRDAATDSAGDVYVADYANKRIVEFAPGDSNNVLRTWGSAGSGPLQFADPYGVAFDSADHLYVADSNNGRIQEFDVSAAAPATPTLIATYGSKSAAGDPNGLFALRRVAVTPGPNPKVWGFDLWGSKAVRYTLQVTTDFPVNVTTPDLVIGGAAAPSGLFNLNYGVAVGGGNIYVSDTNNQRMQVFDQASLNYLNAFGKRGFGETNLGFNWPRALAYAPATGTLWVADTKNSRVSEFDLQGNATGRVIGGPKVLNYPFDVASLGSDVLVADTLHNRVQLWDPTTMTVIWSTDSIGIPLGQPKALTVGRDPDDPSRQDVYVTNTLGHQIVVLDAATGALLRTIQPVINGVTVLHRIEGVAVDPRTGNLWVSDSSWNRLVELAPGGTSLIRTVGKLGTAPDQFNYPAHLAIDTVGGATLLYADDYQNSRVQILDITNF